MTVALVTVWEVIPTDRCWRDGRAHEQPAELGRARLGKRAERSGSGKPARHGSRLMGQLASGSSFEGFR